MNQGYSQTCTCYAIANAAADQLADKGINIDQSVFAGILVDKKGNIGPVWPHFYDNYHDSILVMDQDNEKYYYIKITTVRCVTKFDNKHKHVLAYHTTSNDYHCVFVKEKKGNSYSCINSWGNYCKYPQVEIHKPGNTLWIVSVDFAREGWYIVSYFP